MNIRTVEGALENQIWESGGRTHAWEVSSEENFMKVVKINKK